MTPLSFSVARPRCPAGGTVVESARPHTCGIALDGLGDELAGLFGRLLDHTITLAERSRYDWLHREINRLGDCDPRATLCRGWSVLAFEPRRAA